MTTQAKLDYFKLNEIITEYHYIPLTQEQVKTLQLNSDLAAKKLVQSECVKLVSKDNAESYAIEIQKKGGLSVLETTNAQTFSDKMFVLYQEISTYYKSKGKTEEEIRAIVDDTTNYSSWPEEIKAKGYLLIKELSQSQNKKESIVENITLVIQSRLIKGWTKKDTQCLPESLIVEFLNFIANEKNQWKEIEEKETEGLPEKVKKPVITLAS